MRPARAFSTLVLSAVFVAACGVTGVGNETVPLRTSSKPACYAGLWGGGLAFDPGTNTFTFTPDSYGSVPVEWPSSWTGRRSGSEVEILNRHGEVLYRTGTRVHLQGGSDYTAADHAFLACSIER
ncbi:MAG: hypothetical protein ABI565_14485 [Vicinamibacteria bacterium]